MLADFYPTVVDVVALHTFVLARTGATPAASRDEGVLDGALNRPRMASALRERGQSDPAVLLLTGVALAHAFVAGNKRTALIVGDTFLARNGWAFTGDYLELAKRIEAVVNRIRPLQETTNAFSA